MMNDFVDADKNKRNFQENYKYYKKGHLFFRENNSRKAVSSKYVNCSPLFLKYIIKGQKSSDIVINEQKFTN